MSAFSCTCDSCEMGISDHLLDRLDTGNSLLGVRKSQRNRARQLAVNVNRASAHSLHHSSSLQRSAGQPRQNDGLPWSDVLEYAEDFDLELFDALPLEDGPADSTQSGVDIAKGEKTLAGGTAAGAQRKKNNQRRGESPQRNESINQYFRPRRGGDLSHIGHCLSELMLSFCD